MNDRIKAIRISSDLTQDEFGRRIGAARNTIANYENGKRTPSNSVINVICRAYNVNEEWLRDGTGEMFNVDQNNIDFLVGKYGANLNKAQKILLAMILKMDDRQREAAEQFIEELIALRDQF
jgi:transcriptional regulator with XRE-family HTH domain